MKRTISLLFLSGLLLTACGGHHASDETTIKVGTIAGPETQLMEVAKEVAKSQYHTNIKIVQFSDYVMPNVALHDQSIDANVYQHQPYLDATMATHGYHFTAISKTFIYPMGIYSKKIKVLSELKDHAVVAIPNDPSNGARALLLLQNAGVIRLKPGATINATVNDITANPRHISIKELDAAQLPRVLRDVDLAVINTTYSLPAGLLPKRDGLFIEDTHSPYANLVVVRTENKDDPKFKVLIDSLHSPEVIAKAKELFQGQAVQGW